MYFGRLAQFKTFSTVTTAATGTAPAGPYDLTTLVTVEGELNIASGGPADAVLQRYITAASAAIAVYCNRVFPVQTYQDTFFPQRDPPISPVIGGVQDLQLAQYPLPAPASSVTENGFALTAEVDYTEDDEIGQLTRLDCRGYPQLWPKREIIVQYQAGFDPLPVDLADACIAMVTQRWFARGRDPMMRSEKIPGVAEYQYWVQAGTAASSGANFPPAVLSVLNGYRVPVVG